MADQRQPALDQGVGIHSELIKEINRVIFVRMVSCTGWVAIRDAGLTSALEVSYAASCLFHAGDACPICVFAVDNLILEGKDPLV